MTHEDQPDWYLKEWMNHFGKKQANLVKELDWQRARASKVWNGVNEYRRDLVNEISNWLGIEPFELLLPPERALALRAMQESAEKIVSAAERFLPQPPIIPSSSRPAKKA